MTHIGFHPEAKLEASAAVTYYEQQQPGLGLRFINSLEDALHRIQMHPFLYKHDKFKVRKCRVLRFPYGLLYRCDDSTIEIIAVMHLRREPGYWKSRVSSQ